MQNRLAQQNTWLLVIDPQNIFADPNSAWGSPMFADAWQNIAALARKYAGRVIFTRWLPTADRNTSWGDYFQAWPFADKPAADQLFNLTPEAAALAAELAAPVLDFSGFGKWSSELQKLVWPENAPTPTLLLTGVATDCCVISSALPMVDSGAYVRVVTDAVAASTPENQAAALQIMELYSPQLTLTTTQEVLSQ